MGVGEHGQKTAPTAMNMKKSMHMELRGGSQSTLSRVPSPADIVPELLVLLHRSKAMPLHDRLPFPNHHRLAAETSCPDRTPYRKDRLEKCLCLLVSILFRSFPSAGSQIVLAAAEA